MSALSPASLPQLLSASPPSTRRQRRRRSASWIGVAAVAVAVAGAGAVALPAAALAVWSRWLLGLMGPLPKWCARTARARRPALHPTTAQRWHWPPLRGHRPGGRAGPGRG